MTGEQAIAYALQAAPSARLDDLEAQPPVSGENQTLTEPLSERELELLRLVSEGRSNREIAAALFLAVGTVKWYLKQINGKLGVNSRTQAIAQARKLNLL